MSPFRLFLFIVLCICLVSQQMHAQSQTLSGQVVDSLDHGIPNVLIESTQAGGLGTTDQDGNFAVLLPIGEHVIIFSHLGYLEVSRTVDLSTSQKLRIMLRPKSQVLEDVEIVDQSAVLYDDQSLTRISSKSVTALTTVAGEFTKILATLPGVSSNNELSSVYSVRGGNYDENLIYVNGMQVYRPQIISAGRQEGLSFVNPDMVRSIKFSAGGWQASYGDKLSSVLDVEYGEPINPEAVVDLGLLGGRLYYGGVSKKGDFTYMAGVRHKNTRYLLGTLETQGQYRPSFTDVQTYWTKRLSDQTKLSFLTSSAINRYRTTPEFQETEFGTLQNSFRLNVAFDGQELLNYDTHQLGVKLTHAVSDRWLSTLSVSGAYSTERENYEIEGGYLLCNLNNNPGSNRFNECISILGIGTNYTFGRNLLKANILNAEQRNEIVVNNDLLEFGMSWSYEALDDRLLEFAFTDSADFSQVTASRDNEIDITSAKTAAYVQYTMANSDSSQTLNFGARVNYWTLSEQWLISPRVQYTYRFGQHRNNQIRASVGLYQQHPFYRELRDRDGNFNNDVKAQSSAHYIVGWDRFMTIWGRPFMLTTDAYYKRLWNVNLYDVNNVKIRYFADNQARAYAYGFDVRMNGEFIAGTESWFSLSYLKTEEMAGGQTEYVRRPMDQRVNLGVFFQDHIPNDPTMRVSLNLLYGSGLPFGPPNNDAFRNAFDGDMYTRVDVGFAKDFYLKNEKFLIPNKVTIGVDVLNLLGTDNAISYTWIEDVNANQFAVPNALSARFFNARITAKF